VQQDLPLPEAVFCPLRLIGTQNPAAPALDVVALHAAAKLSLVAAPPSRAASSRWTSRRGRCTA